MATAHTGINTRLVVVQKSADFLFSSPASDYFAREKAEILKTAPRDKDSHLLAPNRKPSKLTEDQWATVRTKAFKRWFGDWLAVTNRAFLESDPVATLTGDEFKSDGVPLTEKVPKWYAEKGLSVVEVEGVGAVQLDAHAVKNSLSHGIGRDKAAAFAAVPEVLRKGRIIHAEELRGTRDGGIAFHIAAPIRMGGEEMIVDVLVKSDPTMTRMYVHEVAAKNKLQQSVFKTGADAAGAGVRAGTDAGAIRNILQSVFAVNPETVSKVVDENGEPMVVHHGSAETGIKTLDRTQVSRIQSQAIGVNPLIPVFQNEKHNSTNPLVEPRFPTFATPSDIENLDATLRKKLS